MSPLENGFDVGKFRTLELVDPQGAMDQIEALVRVHSAAELARILKAIYEDIAVGLAIDWNFTALQWKIGNWGSHEFSDVCPQARFKVWSFPFVEITGDASQKRYATCLPFQFKSEWGTRSASAARH
jgi:hypothetical protein